jgi:hypothetical protein
MLELWAHVRGSDWEKRKAAVSLRKMRGGPNVNTSLPASYYRQSSGGRLTCIISALSELGFDLRRLVEIKVEVRSDWFSVALASFNAATIMQVFGLAVILAENQPLTVRGAMYRGVGTLWVDTSDSSYNTSNRLILKMRRLGLIPYSWIVDGTRKWDKPGSWSGLADYAEAVAESYRKNLWDRQTDYIEIFVEKDAMSGIVRPVTREYDIKLNPIRGFASETFLWSIAEEWKEIEKPINVYYLGDHDPAGLKIEADLRRRLENFCGFRVHWERLAITEKDFESDLLGFPVKRGSAAANWQPYVDRFGDRCVEVDALPATVVRDRVRQAIESHIDQREWALLKAQEERERSDVLKMVRALNGEEAE